MRNSIFHTPALPGGVRRRAGALALVLGAALVAGCGSTSSESTARLRGVDLSPNGGTTGVLVNGSANGGDLSFGESSPYNFIGQGYQDFFFSTTATITTVTQPPHVALQLNNGSFYTEYLIGRSDVGDIRTAVTNPRFLQAVVTGNKGAAAGYAVTPYADPPSGQANVRILNGAPDAGPVDVLINGKVAFPAVAYPVLPRLALATDANTPAVNPVTLYQVTPSGTLSVQVNAAGTSTILVPPTNVSIGGGSANTIVVTEPTVAPTYGLYTASDQ